MHITHVWHDQGKWVTCRKSQFLFSDTTFSILQNALFWCKSHYNWIASYRVMNDLTMLKTICNKGIWTLFLPIFQKQHFRHPTHSSWSCHIFFLLYDHNKQCTLHYSNILFFILGIYIGTLSKMYAYISVVIEWIMIDVLS